MVSVKEKVAFLSLYICTIRILANIIKKNNQACVPVLF